MVKAKFNKTTKEMTWNCNKPQYQIPDGMMMPMVINDMQKEFHILLMRAVSWKKSRFNW
jgi:hypothetical protein